MFDSDGTLVIVKSDRQLTCSKISTDVVKVDFSDYTFEQALLILYAQKCQKGYVQVSFLQEEMQNTYEMFTKEQKKQLQHILKS